MTMRLHPASWFSNLPEPERNYNLQMSGGAQVRRGLGNGALGLATGQKGTGKQGRVRQRLRERERDKRATQGVGGGDCETDRG